MATTAAPRIVLSRGWPGNETSTSAITTSRESAVERIHGQVPGLGALSQIAVGTIRVDVLSHIQHVFALMACLHSFISSFSHAFVLIAFHHTHVRPSFMESCGAPGFPLVGSSVRSASDQHPTSGLPRSPHGPCLVLGAKRIVPPRCGCRGAAVAAACGAWTLQVIEGKCSRGARWAPRRLRLISRWVAPFAIERWAL